MNNKTRGSDARPQTAHNPLNDSVFMPLQNAEQTRDYPMFVLKKLLSALILPPFGLLLLLIAGLCLKYRHPRLARSLIAVSLVLLMLSSIPLIGTYLARTLEETPPISGSAAVIRNFMEPVQAIVVLGGGTYHGAIEYGGDTVNAHSLERLRYAALLHKTVRRPLLVSGGAPFGGTPEAEAMHRVLVDEFGVPVRWVETESRDTAENAEFSARLLRQEGIVHIALVTHAWHMPRAATLFRQQGLTVLPAPTGFTGDSPSLLENLLPRASAMERSSFAIREWLGLLWSRR